jgi:myo-inositol-1(or 4)-monophosphatase
MADQTNWLKIVVACKNAVLKRIAPLLKTLNAPQPNLGLGAGGDPIRKIDLAAESAIVETVKKHEVSFTLISEESGTKEYGESPSQNFVTTDPIDGTTNLMRGIPFYATSIAVSARPSLDSVHTALVEDLHHGVTYTAQRGRGAYSNGQRLTPSKITSLEEAVIGVDINTYKVRKIASQLTTLIERTKHLRHLGANALELCYVADGTTDAFIDIRGKLRTTDMAAASLILKEAGARITSPEGKPLRIKLDPKQTVFFVAAANKEIHRIILDLIRPRKEI